jgi:UrcA family protein
MLAKKMALTTKSAVLAAALITFIPALSQADAPFVGAKSMRLSTAGFDLNTEAGATAFYAHVTNVVGSVCNSGMSSDPIYGSQVDACIKATLQSAIKSLHKPMLTAVFNARNPRSVLPVNDMERLASK